MKTVGIFGDSHADCSYLEEWKTTYSNIGPGWPELLALEYKVTNFAAGGSSMYYSYDLFKKMQANFDIVIFVPSQGERFSLFLPDSRQTKHIVPSFLLSRAEHELRDNKNSPTDLKVINAAIGYVSYILNQTKETEIKRLMLQEIRQVRPDTIFVPAFTEDSIDGYVDLFQLSSKELSHYNTSWKTLGNSKPPLFDVRKCHITDGNNKVVFNKVMTAIENKDTFIKLVDSDFVKPTDSFKKYFVHDNYGRTNI